ncbi:hypothetical protein ACFL2U_03710 [Patescibacteria group bacterium]
MEKRAINPNIKILLDATKGRREGFYLTKINSSLKELQKYFKKNPKNISVNIYKNKNNFLKVLNKKNIPDWYIAHIPPKSTSQIHIFDNIKSPIKAQTIKQVITHEITHLYTNILNPKLPDWLKEGLSVYFAEQIFNPKINSKNWAKINKNNSPFNKIKWQDAVKQDGYNIAGLWVLFFIQRYGWESVLETFKKQDGSFSSLARHFEEEPDYLINDFEKKFVNK